MSVEDIATQGARSILDRCLNLSEGGHFLLLIDETTGDVVDPFYGAAKSLGVQLTTLFFSRLQQLELQDLGSLAKSALENADAALLAHTAADPYSRFRTKLVSEWRGATRLGTMPGANKKILEVAAGTDYEFLITQCRKLTLPLLHGRKCIVKTFDRNGRDYDLSFLLGGIERVPVQSTGILGDKAWGNVPSGEIFTAPLEESAEGEYLVNGAIGDSPMKDDEAVLTFQGGRLVGHRSLRTGGPMASLLEIERISQDRNDTHWNVIAEFGIGVNSGLREITGSSLLDEKIFGTVHIAIGHNVGWQGRNRAQHHLDIITKAPTVTIDGRAIIDRGRHVVKPEEFDDLDIYEPHPSRSWPSGTEVLSEIGEDAYRKEDGQLIIDYHTQSGRVTELVVADESTRSLVNQALRVLGEGSGTLKSLLLSNQTLTQEKIRKLLSLLWTYGIITPGRKR